MAFMMENSSACPNALETPPTYAFFAGIAQYGCYVVVPTLFQNFCILLAHFEEETGSMYLLTTTGSISPALKGCMAECEIQYHVIQIENPVSLSVSVD